MHLLVSVRDAHEAATALAAGADVIDAKDPAAGALGAVLPEVFREIRTVVGDARPVTAALGDPSDARTIGDAARYAAAAGARFVKVGFAEAGSESTAAAILAAAVFGARAASLEKTGVVAVAYADAARASSLAFEQILAIASDSGAEGVLVDTRNKRGPGLCELISPATLSSWTARAHRAGLLMAVAGTLTAGDLPVVRRAGADVAGVRGAACLDGRTGAISAERVRLLVDVVNGGRQDVDLIGGHTRRDDARRKSPGEMRID